MSTPENASDNTKAKKPKRKSTSVKKQTTAPATGSGNGQAKETLRDGSVSYDEDNFTISINGRFGPNCVAQNFLLFIQCMMIDEYERQTWILEIRVKDKLSILIDVPHEDFTSVSKLKRLIASKQYSLQISESELSKLHHYLFCTEYPTAIKIVRLGFHAESEVYFFANAAIHNGKLLEPDKFGLVTVKPIKLVMPSFAKGIRHPMTLSNNTVSFNDWYAIFRDAHLENNAFIPTCFYVMSLFRDLAIDLKNFSPILYMMGIPGSGKTTVCRGLTCLFGYQGKDINLKSKNTAAGLSKIMAQTSNTLTFFDEYDNDFEFTSLLQAAYDNAGYHLSSGVGTTETSQITIKSALALTSNYIPSNEIFFSRCLYLPVNKTIKTKEQRIAFEKLKFYQDQGLGSVSVELLQQRSLVKEQFVSAYAELLDGFTTRLPNTSERLRQNMALTMTSAYILNTSGSLVMKPREDKKTILDYFLHHGKEAIERQHAVQNGKSALTEYFNILRHLIDRKEIQSGSHYNLRENVFSWRFSQISTLFQKTYRQVHHQSPPEIDEIKRQLTEISPSSSEFRQLSFLPTINEKTDRRTIGIKGSFQIDYQILNERFGFYL